MSSAGSTQAASFGSRDQRAKSIDTASSVGTASRANGDNKLTKSAIDAPKKRVKVYPEPEKRVRAKKPKSKTGCFTCKTRRVKCGEEKPHCLKCRRFGVECEGYASSQLSQQGGHRLLQILPRTFNSFPVNILPITALFQDQLEYQYFLHFRDEISHDLSGTSQTIPQRLWDTVILRACNESLPLRDLTTSIAALSKANKSPDTGPKSEHHVFAVRYYGRALRGIQEAITTCNKEDIARITLIASLLIFCFENMQGEHESAVAHIRTALKMMRKRFSTTDRQYSIIKRAASIPGFEDELLDVFVKIDNTLMVRICERPDDQNSALDIAYTVEDSYMPHAFRSLVEAHNYLEHYQFNAMPYLARLPYVFMYETNTLSATETKAYDELICQLHQWNAAFEPLFTKVWKTPGSPDFIAAATIRCLALGTEMSVRRIATAAGTTEDFAEEASEIVELARRVISDKSFKKTFVFECGVLPPLFIVTMLCRKRSVSLEAIRVLRMAEGRMEVTWDAAVVANMAEMAMVAKEQEQPPLDNSEMI